MSPFEHLDQMLAAAEPGDAWADDGVLLAADLLRAFKPDDWTQMAGRWASRPERWQRLAADVLADGDEEQAVPLLLDLIGRGVGRARIDACDSLRVLLQGAATVRALSWLRVRTFVRPTRSRGLICQRSGWPRRKFLRFNISKFMM